MPYYTCNIETGEIVAKQPDRADRRTDNNVREGYFRVRVAMDLDVGVFHKFCAKPDGRIVALPTKEIKAIEDQHNWHTLRVERNKWFELLDGAYDRATKDKDNKEKARLLQLRKRAKELPKSYPIVEEASLELQALYEEL